MVTRISFNQFMEFVAASGGPKVTKVRTAIAMQNAADFKQSYWWHDLKKSLTNCLETGDLGALDGCLARIADPRKVDGYEANIVGFRKWKGRKALQPFQVPKRVWSANGLDVSVNPEVGLLIDGVPHVVKLFFKDEKLDQRRVDPALGLMDMTHGSVGTPAVLDCRKSKLFTLKSRSRYTQTLLEAEARHFVDLWESLTSAA